MTDNARYYTLADSILRELIVRNLITEDEVSRIAVVHIPITEHGDPKLINFVLK